MYVRRKVNKSGSISVQIVDKAGGFYRVVCSLGTGREDWELVRLEARGRQYIKGYVTNTGLSNEDVISRYSDLWRIERAFRMNKTDLQVRPIYCFPRFLGPIL